MSTVKTVINDSNDIAAAGESFFMSCGNLCDFYSRSSFIGQIGFFLVRNINTFAVFRVFGIVRRFSFFLIFRAVLTGFFGGIGDFF